MSEKGICTFSSSKTVTSFTTIKRIRSVATGETVIAACSFQSHRAD